jgi:regulatory protein
MAKYHSYDDALAKLQKYCTYQDRCHSEVEQKLWDLGIYDEEDRGNIIVELIQEDFLNELRYAESFTRGKFRIKKWGKTKIINELKAKKVSQHCIKKAIASEIPYEEYQNTLEFLLEKKNNTIRDDDNYKRKQKLLRHGIGKGFETEMVKKTIENLLNS